METKRCSKCGEVKPITEFAKDKSDVGGYARQCKACWKKYREEHKEILARARARRLQNNRAALTRDELDFLLEELDYNENMQQQPVEKRGDQGSHLTQEELDFLLDII